MSTDSRMVNCFAEQLPDGRFDVVKRSGLSFSFQGNAGVGQGITNFLDVLYSVSGDVLNINQAFTPGWKQTSLNAGFQSRNGVMAVGFSGRLWVMGGVSQNSVHFNDVYSSLDGVTWTLVTSNAPWSPRRFGSAIVFNGKLWIMGGANSTSIGLSDVWWTSDGINWNLANSNAWPGRDAFGLTLFNGKMWIAGGQTGDGLSHYSDVWSSVDGSSWIQVTANAPWVARSRLGFAGFMGKLIVLGGELQPTAYAGATGDLWTSLDGATWTRISSNPFGQASSGVFPRAVLTSSGAEYWIAPSLVTLSGGGGSGAIAIAEAFDDEQDDADNGGQISMVSVITPGVGYTAAPSLVIETGGGLTSTGYTFLNAIGASGDKRGMFAVSNAMLYFFATYNNAAPSNEIWQSPDGITWSLTDGNAAYGPRDTTAIAFGNFWVFAGNNASGFTLNDVWSGNLQPNNSITLPFTASNLRMSFSQTSTTVTSPLLFFKSTVDAYLYNPATTLLTTVKNLPNYPPSTVPGIVYIDGYFVIMDQYGKIWQSAINDATTWTSLGFIAMQSEPNGGVAIAKVDNYIVAFGQWSIQFFYDAALPPPGSPFAVNDTLTNLTGCASGYSVIEMQGSVVWLGQNKREGRGVYMLQGLKPIRISSPFVDRVLQFDDLSDVRAYSTEISGHSMYVLTLIRSNVTLVYDFQSQLWAKWTTRQPASSFNIQQLTCDPYGLVTANAPRHGQLDGDPITVSTAIVPGYNGPASISLIDADNFSYQVPMALPASAGVSQASYTSEGYFYGISSTQLKGIDYIQHENNGIIFQFSPAAVNDYGNPIDVNIITSSWDGGTRGKKFMSSIELLADNVSGVALLRYTNDDYKTYSAYRRMPLFLARSRLTRLGTFSRRAFQLRYTDSTPFRAEALEITVEDGSE